MKAAAEARFQRIHAYQRHEIERLSKEPAFALRASRRVHFSHIGEWLGADEAGRTLELGCGPGRYVAMLSTLGHAVTGVDPHEFPVWSLIRENTGATLQSGVFAEALPFDDGAFDNLACMAAMLYFKDLDRAFSEMRRVIKPGGRAVFRTVTDRHLYTRVTGKRFDPEAPNYFTEATLRQTLTQRGFETRRMFTYGFAPPFFSAEWWGLVNGPIPIIAQETLSALTPRDMRLNVTAFAIRR